jgi:SNF2 family DNA or RNA helicase
LDLAISILMMLLYQIDHAEGNHALESSAGAAVEAQAIDRTHRIGQTETVNAYRLIAPGTVEEKIWELQQSKAKTIADVLGEEGFARSLSQADLEYLFADD